MDKSKAFASARYGLFAAACLILVFQASASRMLKVDEEKIGIPGLHELPWQIGPWKSSSERSIGPDVTAYLRPDEYILRDYVDQRKGGTIDLFVAYFKSLQNSYGPHSPKICLPGSGWLVSSSKLVNIPVPGRAQAIPVNQFTMEQANRTYRGALLVPKCPGCLGRGVSRQAAAVAGPDPLPAFRRQPGASGGAL